MIAHIRDELKRRWIRRPSEERSHQTPELKAQARVLGDILNDVLSVLSVVKDCLKLFNAVREYPGTNIHQEHNRNSEEYLERNLAARIIENGPNRNAKHRTAFYRDRQGDQFEV